jgi:hypothetical protein
LYVYGEATPQQIRPVRSASHKLFGNLLAALPKPPLTVEGILLYPLADEPVDVGLMVRGDRGQLKTR